MSKAENQLYHFKEQCKERFRLTITDEDVANMIELIRSSKSIVVPGKKKINRTTVHRIVYCDTTIDVVYDNKRQVLVTALYPKGGKNVVRQRKGECFPNGDKASRA